MIIKLDTRTTEVVIALAKDLARAFRKEKQDTLDLINRYTPSNSSVSEGIALNLPEEEDRIFARTMILIKDIYQEIHKESLENDYSVIGARYLLMPERQFIRNCEECNFNLFDLKRHYPHVSFNNIAQHITDVEMCLTCQRTYKRYHGYCKNQGVYVSNLNYKIMDRIADNTLASPYKTYTEQLNDNLRVTGWRTADNEVQIICFGEDL